MSRTKSHAHARKLTARWRQLASLVALVGLLGAAAIGAAGAARAQRPTDPASVSTLRALVGHYRSVTWTFERAARRPRERSAFVDRRTKDRHFLRFAIDLWTRRAYTAQAEAVRALHTRLAIALPAPPTLRASLRARVRYSRRLTVALRNIYPGNGAASRSLAGAVSVRGGARLRLWQRRSALAALDVSRHAVRRARIPASLQQAFLCIHSYEADWDADTGNGYYGGLQMDLPFQSHYGHEYVARYGTADRWPVWAQLEVAARAYRDVGGFWPWPNTARACGLL
jgi:hypothetical protein